MPSYLLSCEWYNNFWLQTTKWCSFIIKIDSLSIKKNSVNPDHVLFMLMLFNNFSVIVGQLPVFLGSTKQRIQCLNAQTQCSASSESWTSGSSISCLTLNHWATAFLMIRIYTVCKNWNTIFKNLCAHVQWTSQIWFKQLRYKRK